MSADSSAGVECEQVYLVPGFFGFANLGDFRYFGHVRRFIQARFDGENQPCVVHEVQTRPTASLHHRAGLLADTILATAGPNDRIHIVGHSSGGLDARVLLAPGTILGDRDLAGITRRTASLVTVSTPHWGTPAAAAFGSLAGGALLRLLSAMTIVVLRRGQVPLKALVGIGRLARRAEQTLDGERGMVDELLAALLGDLTAERREAVRAFMADVGDDQALLDQITPAAMGLFNATLPDADSVRYGSVVTRARRPSLAGVAEIGLKPSAQAAAALHFACHRMAAFKREPTWLSAQHAQVLQARWPELLDDDNDGMVPTTSQPWGTVLHTADADHLDVIGHFSGAEGNPPHYDWIRTGTGFRNGPFDRVWSDVVAFQQGS